MDGGEICILSAVRSGGVALDVSGVIGGGELLPYNSSSSGGAGIRVTLLSGGRIVSLAIVSCVIGRFW